MSDERNFRVDFSDPVMVEQYVHEYFAAESEARNAAQSFVANGPPDTSRTAYVSRPIALYHMQHSVSSIEYTAIPDQPAQPSQQNEGQFEEDGSSIREAPSGTDTEGRKQPAQDAAANAFCGCVDRCIGRLGATEQCKGLKPTELATSEEGLAQLSPSNEGQPVPGTGQESRDILELSDKYPQFPPGVPVHVPAMGPGTQDLIVTYRPDAYERPAEPAPVEQSNEETPDTLRRANADREEVDA